MHEGPQVHARCGHATIHEPAQGVARCPSPHTLPGPRTSSCFSPKQLATTIHGIKMILLV